MKTNAPFALDVQRRTPPQHGMPASPAARLIPAAIAIALLGSVAEGGLILVKKHVLHHYVHIGLQAVWMTPVSNVGLLLLLAMVLTGIARLRPKWMPIPLGVGLLAFVMALGVLLVSGALHPAATALLAAGAAVQVGRIARSHPAFLDRVVAALSAWTTLPFRSRRGTASDGSRHPSNSTPHPARR